MMKFNSITQWKNYCFNTHKKYIKNRYFASWVEGKNIDIFNYTTLRKEEVKHIKISIEKALKLCGPDFKIRLLKRQFHELDSAVKNGSLVGSKILRMVKNSRKMDKSCNACIFLVNKRVKSNIELLEFGDALTYVSDGVIIFTFDRSIKYPKAFFRNEVAHETYHLLGLNVHHQEAEVEGYGKQAKCVMEYNAPSEKLCQKCKDGLQSFWKGVRYAIQQ